MHTGSASRRRPGRRRRRRREEQILGLHVAVRDVVSAVHGVKREKQLAHERAHEGVAVRAAPHVPPPVAGCEQGGQPDRRSNAH